MNLSSRLVLLLILLYTCVSMPATGFAADKSPALHGRIFSDIYVPTRQPVTDSFLQVSTIGWLQWDQKLDPSSSVYINLEAASNFASVSQPSQPTGTTVVSLREGYLIHSESGFDFRIGKQIVPWGNADGINPTDFLTAKDNTRFNPDEEVKRLGAPMVQMSVTPNRGTSPFTLTGVYIPVFAKSTLLIPSSTIPSGATLNSSVTPATNLANSEAAVKLAYSGEGFDFSVLGFYGWQHLPDLELGTITTSGGNITAVTINPTFHKIRAIGGDASFTAGKFVFRGESAFVWTQNNDGANPTIQPSYWNTVAGVERPFGDNFRVQIQFVEKYFPRYTNPSAIPVSSPSDAIVQQIAIGNSQIQGYTQRLRSGMTGRITYGSDRDPLTLEFFALVFFDNEFVASPSLTYAWTDNLKTQLGANQYGGASSTQLGAFNEFSNVFFEGRYLF